MAEIPIANLFYLEQDPPPEGISPPQSGNVDDILRFLKEISQGIVRVNIGQILLTGDPDVPIRIQVTCDALSQLPADTISQLRTIADEAGSGLPYAVPREHPVPLTATNALELIHFIRNRTQERVQAEAITQQT